MNAVLRSAAAIACSGILSLTAAACRERGRPDPSVRMAVSHDPEAASGSASDAPASEGAAGSGPANSAQKPPTRLEVPPEVEKTWAGIRLHWKDSSTGKEGSLDVPIGGIVALPGSDLQVRADVFLPAFTMTNDAITSSSVEADNPAARISIAEKGALVFEGWLFTRFPDVHPFQHPRFSIRLEGGVRRTS
jgi:hypothetical protein